MCIVLSIYWDMQNVHCIPILEHHKGASITNVRNASTVNVRCSDLCCARWEVWKCNFLHSAKWFQGSFALCKVGSVNTGCVLHFTSSTYRKICCVSHFARWVLWTKMQCFCTRHSARPPFLLQFQTQSLLQLLHILHLAQGCQSIIIILFNVIIATVEIVTD